MSKDIKTVTLKQAEKVHGYYEVIINAGKCGYRLMAKLEDLEAMKNAQQRMIEEKLMVVLIVP
jgi:hypothetical protein